MVSYGVPSPGGSTSTFQRETLSVSSPRCNSSQDVRRTNRKKVAVKHEYDVIDEVEENNDVQILPSMPRKHHQEYADRDFLRSSSSHSLLSVGFGDTNVPSSHPPRETPPLPPPAPLIRRDLKPGKQKRPSDINAPPVKSGNQVGLNAIAASHRTSCSSTPYSISGLRATCGPKATLPWPQSNCREIPPTNRQDKCQHVQPDDHHKCSNIIGSNSMPESYQRHSSAVELRSSHTWEKVQKSRILHKWPQTNEVSQEQHVVPVKKLPQINSKKDWYVGVCNRADAEHALHLVNKDGAFLVRDSTINTNSRPLVLVVYHDKKVYNVRIRFFEIASKFALQGHTQQHFTELFDSVADIISYHSTFPILFIGGRYSAQKEHSCVRLTLPLTKADVDQLLQ